VNRRETGRNEKYPQIAEDFQGTFSFLRALPCDVFLASHASIYNGLEKAARLAKGEQPNPFVDPKGFRDFLNAQETAFQTELAKAQRPAKGN
jgi:metallo-beta-lactamase class B